MSQFETVFSICDKCTILEVSAQTLLREAHNIDLHSDVMCRISRVFQDDSVSILPEKYKNSNIKYRKKTCL